MVKKQQMPWTPPVEHIYCCRPVQRCLTMNSKRYPADGIRDSAQRREPPRTLGGLPDLLRMSKRWLDECVRLKDNTFPQLLLLMRFPQVHSHSFGAPSVWPRFVPLQV